MATRLRPAPVPLCELPDVAGRSDVVVVARRARRFADPFRLGSSIERLLKYGAAPVIVARGYRWMCRRDALPMKHVLVVLDGAAEAERALPAALAIAEATEGELTLLRVVPGQPYYGTPSIESEFAAHAYLERVARSLESRQLLVAPAVRSSNEELGEVILSFAQDHNVDLIAMATSLRRSLVGKIHRRPARYLVRQGTIPVLLTNADSAASGVDALARHAAT